MSVVVGCQEDLFQNVHVKSVLETEVIHTPMIQMQDSNYY